MKIAVVTGASSGLGREFARGILREESVDELWVIARREERLRQLQDELGPKVRTFAMDLLQKESYEQLKQALIQERPEISVLVNASGFGKYGTYQDLTDREIDDMMDPTVIWLPKNLTLDNIRFVLGSTDFVGAFSVRCCCLLAAQCCRCSLAP